MHGAQEGNDELVELMLKTGKAGLNNQSQVRNLERSPAPFSFDT